MFSKFEKKYKVHKLCKIMQNGCQIKNFLNTCQFLSNYSNNFFKGHWQRKFALPIIKVLHSLTMSMVLIPYQTLSFTSYLHLKVARYTFLIGSLGSRK